MTELINALAIAAQSEAPKGLGGGNMFFFIALIFGAFWFIIIRPQRRQESERKSLLESIKKGDEVQTIGGILGTVLSIDQNQGVVTIEVDKNCKLRLTRSAVSTVIDKKAKAAQGKS